MLSSFSGFKAHYAGFTVLVVSEFNEWRMLAYAPGVTLHGPRQFSEIKAKENARLLVDKYVREKRGEEPPSGEIEWEPTTSEDWVVWRG